MILGVESVEDDSNMEVYPNPANDIIYMKGDNIQYVEIYNALGAKVLEKYNIAYIYPDTYTVPDMMELLFKTWREENE